MTHMDNVWKGGGTKKNLSSCNFCIFPNGTKGLRRQRCGESRKIFVVKISNMGKRCLKQYHNHHECCLTSNNVTFNQFSNFPNLGLKYHLLRVQSPVCPPTWPILPHWKVNWKPCFCFPIALDLLGLCIHFVFYICVASISASSASATTSFLLLLKLWFRFLQLCFSCALVGLRFRSASVPPRFLLSSASVPPWFHFNSSLVPLHFLFGSSFALIWFRFGSASFLLPFACFVNDSLIGLASCCVVLLIREQLCLA